MAVNEDNIETVRGTVEKIIFSNEENGYAVAVFVPAKGEPVQESFTIVGSFHELVEGEALLVEGRWATHKRFGKQFAVERYSSIAPPTLVGLERYLASRLIAGVGEEFARRIVAHFKDDTIDVLDNHQERLREVSGIGAKRHRAIIDGWNSNRGVRDVMVFLQGLGISAAYATRIYKVFGAGAIDVIKDNPFRLAAEIEGIGFKKADAIAKNLGFPHDSPQRVQAGVLYLLGELAMDGNTCYPRQMLVAKASELMQVELADVETALREQEACGNIAIEHDADAEPVYLRGMFDAEDAVAHLLRGLARAESALHDFNAAAEVAWAEKRNSISLAPAQREAIETVLKSKVTIITGGPGVGKTTIVNCIIPILRRNGMTVLLAAPTGRAAKRLEETTGHQAQTIHRLLKWNPMTRDFSKNMQDPLECDALIIDESSMIDIELMRDLLLAVPPTATVVLVGDVDQLPSVGPGNVLRDVINSGLFPVKRLDQIFRQSERSTIITNAHKINHGQMPEISAHSQAESEGFYFIERDTPEDIVATVRELCVHRIPQKFGLSAIDDIQVLAPMYKGVAGVTNLNTDLRAWLNPNAEPTVQKFGHTFAPNDKVMQIRNDYDKDVFNGDIGRIVEVNLIDEKIIVKCDERLIEYGYDELDALVPAYAISVHKSQGSEYPAVIIALASHHYVMLQRNLLYTAVTRGRRIVVVVGDRKALAIAVRNDRIRRRHTRLADKLRK